MAMTDYTITNGTVEYSRTIRPADFESKVARVSWSYTIAEGSDAERVTKLLFDMARAVVEVELGLKAKEPIVIVPDNGQEKPVQRKPRAPRQEAVQPEPAKEPNDPLDDIGNPTPPSEPNGSHSSESDGGIGDKELEHEAQQAAKRLRKAGHDLSALRDLGQKYGNGRIGAAPADKRADLMAELKALAA